MGAAAKPEFTPLLKPGFHALGLDEVRKLCVDAFPASITRARLMTNLENIVSRMDGSGVSGNVWLDGSFVTEKLNPEDVDFVLVVTDTELAGMSTQAKAFFHWLSATSLHAQFKLDNYVYVK